ncbi:unnamed protein product [Zymoseptoria tritici ST99CH_1E4]|uniref:Uncharacterized protein n=1 Tax=Zymoseptoria tritici ST99CH_1E4 TaxID=1276532 RepID=A0A2H1H909_ZYMTR|nr:unnamed protein product [Zymoseptoria tritici ST99CH_1E4]
MAPQHMKLMEGDEINVTEDTLVKAGYNLNPEQLESYAQKGRSPYLNPVLLGRRAIELLALQASTTARARSMLYLFKAAVPSSQTRRNASGARVSRDLSSIACAGRATFTTVVATASGHDMANSCELDKRFEPVKDLPPPVPERTTKSGRKVQAPALAPGMAEDPMGFTAVERRKRERKPGEA